MNVCVIGTGYVGLVIAALFADWGHNVTGVDIDSEKIASLKKGIVTIYEPGLEEILKASLKSKRLKFTTRLRSAIKNSEIIFICVGTPRGESGEAELTAVKTVAKSIGKILKPSGGYKVIVTKSTVPVGTNELIKKIITDTVSKGVKFGVVSNPEFLREGSAIEDMRNTDRTVIGSDSKKALNLLSKFYDHLGAPIIECDLRSAELTKYASNAFLATKISFINEMGQLCELADADVSVVASGMGFDKRIGRGFLNVSIGYGGSCFPKDVAALYKISTDQAYDFKLLRAVMEVNELQKLFFVEKIKKFFGENPTDITIACLGLAFKGGTDDVRESVSIKVIRILRGMGASLRLYDPEAMKNGKGVLGESGLYYANNMYDAVKGANAVCILTDWDEFSDINLKRVRNDMVGVSKVIFDGRNLLDQGEVEGLGFIYFAIGKRTNAYKADGNVAVAVLENE